MLNFQQKFGNLLFYEHITSCLIGVGRVIGLWRIFDFGGFEKIARGRKIAFVGDSVTDLATQPVVTTFIGFGGVVTRKKVKEEAEFFIKAKSLEPLLWLVV